VRILVADDNSDVLEAIVFLLEVNGHEVRLATNGKEALEQCLTWRPDCAVLDIAMPQMSGLEVARLIRKKGSEMRLVAVTAWNNGVIRTKAAESGFNVFLAKPVRVKNLMLAITRGVQTRQGFIDRDDREDDDGT
jgi:CheY-like chemotaxis protein